jgi:hypothetical protein
MEKDSVGDVAETGKLDYENGDETLFDKVGVMNYKEQVQNVYPEAVFENSTATSFFKQQEYKASGIKIDGGKWLIFKQAYHHFSEDSLWECAWYRIQKRMLRKFES